MNCRDCKYWADGICLDDVVFFNKEGEPVCRFHPNAIEEATPDVNKLLSEIDRLTAERDLWKKEFFAMEEEAEKWETRCLQAISSTGGK